MFGGPQQGAFVDTIVNVTGIAHFKDLNGGNPNCVSITPLVRDRAYGDPDMSAHLPTSSLQSINWHADDHRSSSIEAYYTPVENRRKGWTILIHHLVTKVLFNGTSSPYTATGVEFAASDGSGIRYQAFARREVIVSAGTIQVCW